MTRAGPANRPTTAPSAKNGPNGIAVRRPCATPRLAMTMTPTSVPAMKRDEQGGSDGAAQHQPHHSGQLDVTHPHPTGIGEGGGQQQPARGGGGDQPLGQLVGLEDRREHEGCRGQRGEDAIGDDPVLEVDAGDRDESRDEDEIEPNRPARTVGDHDGGEQRAGDGLGERVPRERSSARMSGSGRRASARTGPARCHTAGSQHRSRGRPTVGWRVRCRPGGGRPRR